MYELAEALGKKFSNVVVNGDSISLDLSHGVSFHYDRHSPKYWINLIYGMSELLNKLTEPGYDVSEYAKQAKALPFIEMESNNVRDIVCFIDKIKDKSFSDIKKMLNIKQ